MLVAATAARGLANCTAYVSATGSGMWPTVWLSPTRHHRHSEAEVMKYVGLIALAAGSILGGCAAPDQGTQTDDVAAAPPADKLELLENWGSMEATTHLIKVCGYDSCAEGDEGYSERYDRLTLTEGDVSVEFSCRAGGHVDRYEYADIVHDVMKCEMSYGETLLTFDIKHDPQPDAAFILENRAVEGDWDNLPPEIDELFGLESLLGGGQIWFSATARGSLDNDAFTLAARVRPALAPLADVGTTLDFVIDHNLEANVTLTRGQVVTTISGISLLETPGDLTGGLADDATILERFQDALGG